MNEYQTIQFLPEAQLNLPPQADIKRRSDDLINRFREAGDSSNIPFTMAVMFMGFSHVSRDMSTTALETLFQSYDREEVEKLWASCIQQRDFTRLMCISRSPGFISHSFTVLKNAHSHTGELHEQPATTSHPDLPDDFISMTYSFFGQMTN